MKPLNKQGSFGGWATTQPEWVIQAYHTDGLVNKAIKAAFEDGLTDTELWRELAGVLLEQRKKDVKRIIDLEAIAPKRMRCATGAVYIYHCPDHLIPET